VSSIRPTAMSSEARLVHRPATNVYVATSTGTAFTGTAVLWNGWFAFGSEVPMPAVLG